MEPHLEAAQSAAAGGQGPTWKCGYLTGTPRASPVALWANLTKVFLATHPESNGLTGFLGEIEAPRAMKVTTMVTQNPKNRAQNTAGPPNC